VSLHRFYLPPEHCHGEELRLEGPEAHHAYGVLRLSQGQRITVLDGAGGELLCEILDVSRKSVRLKVAQKHSAPPPACDITLLQGVPKGKLFESIIQKATELGARRIVPLLSERAVPDFDSKEAVRKGSKWQAVAIEAIKQCGSAWLPKVEQPQKPQEFLARKELFELPLIASLQPGSRHPRDYFRQFCAQNNRPPRSACLWIGPEGDFSPAEVQLVQSAGALPITLGKLILRTETAAVYCLSMLNYELDWQAS